MVIIKNIIALVVLIAAMGMAKAQDTSAVANVGVQAGNSTAINGTGNQQTLNISGGSSKIPEMIMPVPSTQAQLPFAPPAIIANQIGLPVEIQGRDVDMAYLVQCNPRRVGVDLLVTPNEDGVSKRTKVTFSGHHNMNSMVVKGEVLPDVELVLSGEIRIRCLGKMKIVVSIDSLKIGVTMDLPSVIADAMNSAAAIMKGLPSGIVLMTDLTSIGYALGNSSQGSGMGGGGSIGIPGVVSVGGSGTSLDGTTAPTARIGVPVIIGMRVPENDPTGVNVRIK